MKKIFLIHIFILLAGISALWGCDINANSGCDSQPDDNGNVTGDLILYPASGLQDVNPDVHLRITFPSAPPLGNQGTIRVYDASNNKLVDELDLSIPPGPRNNRTPAPYDTLKYNAIPDTVYSVNNPDLDTTHVYQQNYIGGDTQYDTYHFFPVLINDEEATIVLGGMDT